MGYIYGTEDCFGQSGQPNLSGRASLLLLRDFVIGKTLRILALPLAQSHADYCYEVLYAVHECARKTILERGNSVACLDETQLVSFAVFERFHVGTLTEVKRDVEHVGQGSSYSVISGQVSLLYSVLTNQPVNSRPIAAPTPYEYDHAVTNPSVRTQSPTRPQLVRVSRAQQLKPVSPIGLYKPYAAAVSIQ